MPGLSSSNFDGSSSCAVMSPRLSNSPSRYSRASGPGGSTSGGGTRYALYRQTGVTCGTSGQKKVDYLTTATVFTYTLQSTSSLGVLAVTLPVNTKPETGLPDYRLTDDIVLRNSTRT